MNNPFAWLTNEVFLQYASEVGLHLICHKCSAQPKNFYCDTGSEDGFVPRSSAYQTTQEGYVNMSESRHIPCVRVTCVNCGHIDLYSIVNVAVWRDRKIAAAQTLQPSLFPPGTISG